MKKKYYFTILLFIIAGIGLTTYAATSGRPNLLIIYTDEHNFRTLGCYRNLMSDDQAYAWGEGIKVDTPNLDTLAAAGAICTSYYAASPVCTPSRAAFVSGLYPVATGAWSNNEPMHDDVVTFAEQLRRHGYKTAYVGKWHLDGKKKPGFEPARNFGFSDNRHMFNRGHWKVLHQNGDKSMAPHYSKEAKGNTYSIEGADETSFTTDFLTDRTIEIIERDKGQTFCVMLSIPDPHGPEMVRDPYDTMFAHMSFKEPRTKKVSDSQIPKWNPQTGSNTADEFGQHEMEQYYGMVKCIDDNVGHLLNYLEETGLDKNTIVVFTADHGDLLGEHNRIEKGLPYEASAKIPFLIRYPGKIPKGKVIHKAYTNVDFMPTILGLMDVPQVAGTHGLDDSELFLSADKEIEDDRIVYFTKAGGSWLAVASDRYKLVVSREDSPWLFDLQRDPDELINFFQDPEYKTIGARLMNDLRDKMERYNEGKLSDSEDQLRFH